MEILFENWRRKVEEPEEQNKNSRPNQKPSSSLLRMFKPKVKSFKNREQNLFKTPYRPNLLSADIYGVNFAILTESIA